MKVTGIIMECNPFHEGHAYLLRRARSVTEADYIVVAMSGDFVQRGEPAVFDKYIRAEQILRAGADLVLELPLCAACGSAEYFARGGISLLQGLGVVTDLCFGSESGDLDNLLRCARILTLAEKEDACGHPALYREKLQTLLKKGIPFPAARAAALEETFTAGDCGENASGPLPRYPAVPNDLLGVEYCRALMLCGSAIRPHAIPRIDVPSATQHRKDLLQNRGKQYISLQTSVSQVPLFPMGPDDFSAQLLYALKMHEKELQTYADVSADLADRIQKNLGSYQGFSGFCDLIKTRNLTRTRVSRSLLHILLQIRQERLDALQDTGMTLYARPLALRQSAAPLFSAISKNASVPFLSKLSEAPNLLSAQALSFLEEEFCAEDLYCLTLAGIAAPFSPSGAQPFAVPSARQRKMPVIRP